LAHINVYAVLIAAVISFALGALWYSPVLFKSSWTQSSGVDPDAELDNPVIVMSLTAMLTLLTALALAYLVGPEPHWRHALGIAWLLGAGIVAPSMAINYMFVKHHSIHWAIDAGFHLARLSVMATVFVLWPS
jgi:Protein of unknown function (DUF1761)